MWKFFSSIYGKLYLGKLISDVGTQFYLFGLSWYLLSLTKSAAIVGALLAFRLIVYIILSPMGGVISDRFDRLKLMIVTDYIRGVAMLLGAFAIVASNINQQIVLFYVITFIVGVCDAIFIPSSTSSFRFITDRNDYGKVFANVALINNSKRLIGIFFAGIVFSTVGFEGVLIINGLSFIISGLLESQIGISVKEELDNRSELRSYFSDLKEGIKEFKKYKLLLNVILISIVSNMIYEPVARNGFPYFFNIIAEKTPTFYTALTTSAILGSIMATKYIQNVNVSNIFSHYFNGLKIKFVYIVLLTISFNVYMQGFINFETMYFILFPLFIVHGALGIYINVPSLVYRQKVIPSKHVGKIESNINTLSMSMMPLTTFAGSIIIDKLGFIRLVNLQFGLMTMLMVVLALISIAKRDVIHKLSIEEKAA